MKKVFLLTLLAVVTMAVNAQFKPVQATNSNESTVTLKELTIDGKTFNCEVNKYGNYSINRVSKSGNEYKQYLGYITEYMYLDKPVFTDKKKEKFWYLSLTSTGYPKKMELLKE